MVLKGKVGRFHSSCIYTNLQVLYKGSPICKPVNNIDLSQIGMIGLSMISGTKRLDVPGLGTSFIPAHSYQ